MDKIYYFMELLDWENISCSCIAKSLLDKNKIVIYQTAFTILEILESRRFGKGDKRLGEYQYDLLFDSDLLIIDDLGRNL